MDNVIEWTSLPWLNYSQQHTIDLAEGGFLYRRPSFPANDQTCQGVDEDDNDDDDDEPVLNPFKPVQR
ncbi:hypothetical protein DPMN_051321 [Dreissena polymorpha]|uniref:Uncharacterized protein n=1 Tax=Dreissena polymorpha TaxID=45954 RepID=A0A9D4CIC7_DREPO|nr:hypothetical protein DPMN_051321 [Dreissena polymorpha]